jgi:hypothetical protein
VPSKALFFSFWIFFLPLAGKFSICKAFKIFGSIERYIGPKESTERHFRAKNRALNGISGQNRALNGISGQKRAVNGISMAGSCYM